MEVDNSVQDISEILVEPGFFLSCGCKIIKKYESLSIETKIVSVIVPIRNFTEALIH